MTPLLLGGGLLLLLMLGGGSRSSSGGQVSCDDSAEEVASRSRASLITWATCSGRTQAEVDALAMLLRRARRQRDASAIVAAYRRHLALTPESADGRLSSPAEDRAALADVERESPSPPAPPPSARVTFPGLSDIEEVRAPSGYDAAAARRLAPMVARSLRTGAGYRSALRRFQTASGLTVDGIYGPRSRAALRYYGVADPPPARAALDSPEEYAPPIVSGEVYVSEVLT